MISIYKFNLDANDLEENDFFDENNLEEQTSGDFVLKDYESILEAYLYYEAIQELIIGETISVKKNKKINNKAKKIEELKEIQKEIEQFQNCYMLMFFNKLFCCNSKITKSKTELDNFDCFENLWSMINDTESNEEILIRKDEAIALKAYFNKSILNDLDKELLKEWENIIRKYNKAKGIE